MSLKELTRIRRAKRADHGTRACYTAGCRCEACRRANADGVNRIYAERRRLAEQHPRKPGQTHCLGLDERGCPHNTKLYSNSSGALCAKCRSKLKPNGIVDAAPATRHIKKLRAAGVGLRAIMDASGIPRVTLFKLAKNQRKGIRQEALERLLAVTVEDHCDGALVDAGPVWAMIDYLVKEEGYTKTQIAKMLGSKAKTPALHLSRHKVTAATARGVKAIYDDATGRIIRRRR